MFYYVESLVMILIEVCCCVIFFETFTSKKRRNKFTGFITVMSLVVGLYCGTYILRENFAFKTVIVFVMICTAMYIYCGAGVWKSILLTVIYQALLLVMDYVTFLLYYVGEDKSYEKYSIIILFGKAAVLLVVLVIRKIISKGKQYLPETGQAWYISFSVCTIALITIMVPMTEDMDTDQINLFSAIALVLIVLNIFDFFYIGELQKHAEEKRLSELQKSMDKAQLEKYQYIAESDKIKDSKLHEIKNHLTCIGALAAQHNYENLENYLLDLNKDIFKVEHTISTNHPFFDIVLNAKHKEANAANIEIRCIISDLSEVNIEEKYIVTILSNLLNNAIEACRESESKHIEVQIKKTYKNINILVVNTHNNKIACEKGTFRTSKKVRPEEHGLGIQNIICAIKECEGEYNITHTETKFAFSVTIPL